MIKLLLIICTIFCFVCSVSAQKELLPADNQISGWSLNKNSECFNGDVTHKDSLYVIIDGGDEVFTERGFETGCFRGFNNGQAPVDLCIQIYNQGTAKNAESVYDVTKNSPGSYIFYNDIGDGARLDTTYLGDYYLEMMHKKYFIRLIGQKDDTFKEAMILFMKALSKDITPIISSQSMVLENTHTSLSMNKLNNNFHFSISTGALNPKESQLPTLSIYTGSGRLIRTLFTQRVGMQIQAIWDGTANNTIPVSHGVYTAAIKLGSYRMSKKFIVR